MLIMFNFREDERVDERVEYKKEDALNISFGLGFICNQREQVQYNLL